MMKSINKTQTLLKENEIFRLLVDAVNDYAIFSLDTKGSIQTWNTGAERLKGYKAHEIIGKHFSTFYTEADIDRHHPEDELRIAEAMGKFEEEGWRVRKDGTHFWANVMINKLTDSEGHFIGFSKVTRDLTARRNADLALKQSEERYRLLVDSVKDYAIILLDVEGKITSWNGGAERIKGYKAEEVLGSHFSKFYPQIDKLMGKPRTELEIAIRDGRFEEEGLRIRKDGSTFWASVVITAVRDETGALRGFSKVTRDISERVNAEKELQKLNESLERKVEERTLELTAAVKARDEFLSMASHELNTPLTTLKLKTQMRQKLLKRNGPTHFTEELLTQMFKDDEIHVNRLNRLVDDMLDIARLGGDKLSIVKEEFNLCTHLEAIVERFKPQLNQAKCEISFTGQCEANGFWDPIRVEQIFINLLSNAMKYGQGSLIEVKVSVDDVKAIFSVTDHGRGISSADQARVFKQFERAGVTTEVSGLGLGLYIVKKIVDLHNGDISLQSELGKGSTFTVELPLK